VTDAEIRGVLLKTFHDLRHNAGGWVPTSDMNLSPAAISPQVIGGVCRQLADVGLIDWKPLRGAQGFVIGMARITGKGVAACDAGVSDDIAVRFPGTGRLDEGVVGSPSSASPTVSKPLVQASARSEPSAPGQSPLEASTRISSAEAKRTELLTLKPTLWGMGIDLKEASRWLGIWWKGR
jgi:hypothetical protein